MQSRGVRSFRLVLESFSYQRLKKKSVFWLMNVLKLTCCTLTLWYANNTDTIGSFKLHYTVFQWKQTSNKRHVVVFRLLVFFQQTLALLSWQLLSTIYWTNSCTGRWRNLTHQKWNSREDVKTLEFCLNRCRHVRDRKCLLVFFYTLIAHTGRWR